jgi:predicted metal-dependent HD superfamily phosphohydrolase
MNKIQQNILSNTVGDHIVGYFRKHKAKAHPYYNIEFTRSVVENTMLMAAHYQLGEEDCETAEAAAWFYASGFLGKSVQHEEEAGRLAEKFLLKINADPGFIARVKTTILAVKMPQHPIDLASQILCDAVFFGLGSEKFPEVNELRRREWKLISKTAISRSLWRRQTVELIEAHTYFTDYCRSLLDGQKAENLRQLREQMEDSEKTRIESVHPEAESVGVKKKSPGIRSAQQRERPEKGIETMFRISSGNHQRLSDMADKKAHIMITVNSIILSAIISLVLRKLETSSFLVLPTFILLSVSLGAMIFSILSTRPSVPHGRFSEEDLDQQKVNLLFFGNFYRMGYERYAAGMHVMMEDAGFLYGSLIRDGYAQGVVLGKKYRLLRISYNVFMYGLIVAVISFMLAYLLTGNVTGHEITGVVK